MKKVNSKFNTAFISEAGSLLKNKDYFAFTELDDYACYVIADSIDDDMELESAKIAVASIIRQFTEKPSIKRRAVKNWLKTANRELLNQSKTMRLQASLTVVVTDYASMVYGQAGNTRLCLYREGTLILQSTDQSLSNTMLAEGKISRDKIAAHLERHNLYCYLGQPEGFNPSISDRIKLVDSDTITLFTRGIWENVDIGEMTDAVKDAKEPQEALNNVEDLLLSRQPANLENYTLATIFVDKIYQDPGRRKALIRKIIYTSIPIIIIIIIILIFLYFRHERRAEAAAAMAGHIAAGQTLLSENNYVRAAEEYKTARDIARNLKLENEQQTLDNYYKTIDLIVAADAAFQQKDFIHAAEKYQAALDSSYYADHLGEAYITKQQRLNSDYMNVVELMQSGDQKLEYNDLEGARKFYLEAKVIATKIYFTDARKEAAEKLAKLGDQMKEDDKKVKGQEAAVYEQQGDRRAQMGDYQSAITMLTMASGMYDQSGNHDKAGALQRKISAIEDRMTAADKEAMQRSLAVEGERYEREGDTSALNNDYDGALDQYGLAMSLYDESGKKEKSVLLQKKIDNQNERKRTAEKFDMQQRGMDLEKQGDQAAAQSLFDDARNFYGLAMESYGSVGLSTNVSIVQKKLDTLGQKLTSFEQQKNKAAGYVAEADERTQKGEYVQAKYLYTLAKEIYQQLGLRQEEDQINKKLRQLTTLSNGKV